MSDVALPDYPGLVREARRIAAILFALDELFMSSENIPAEACTITEELVERVAALVANLERHE